MNVRWLNGCVSRGTLNRAILEETCQYPNVGRGLVQKFLSMLNPSLGTALHRFVRHVPHSQDAWQKADLSSLTKAGVASESQSAVEQISQDAHGAVVNGCCVFALDWSTEHHSRVFARNNQEPLTKCIRFAWCLERCGSVCFFFFSPSAPHVSALVSP